MLRVMREKEARDAAVWSNNMKCCDYQEAFVNKNNKNKREFDKRIGSFGFGCNYA